MGGNSSALGSEGVACLLSPGRRRRERQSKMTSRKKRSEGGKNNERSRERRKGGRASWTRRRVLVSRTEKVVVLARVQQPLGDLHLVCKSRLHCGPLIHWSRVAPLKDTAHVSSHHRKEDRGFEDTSRGMTRQFGSWPIASLCARTKYLTMSCQQLCLMDADCCRLPAYRYADILASPDMMSAWIAKQSANMMP